MKQKPSFLFYGIIFLFLIQKSFAFTNFNESSVWRTKSYAPQVAFNATFFNAFFLEEPVSRIIFSEDFEGTSTWNFVNDANNQWVVGTAVSAGVGTKSLYISKDNGLTNTYNVDLKQVSFAYKDFSIPLNVSEIEISFDWRAIGEGGFVSYDYFRVWIIPASETPVAGTKLSESETIIMLGNKDFADKASFVREYLSFDASAFQGQSMRLVFEWINDSGSGTQPPAAIDNIVIAKDDCKAPTAIVHSELTQTSAWIGWDASVTDPSSYEVYVSTENLLPGDEVVPGQTNVTGTSTQVTDLVAGTRYYAWVRSRCSDTSYSGWSGPSIFTTQQIPHTLPFIESFESEIKWTFNNDKTNRWEVGTAVATAGTKALYISNNDGVSNTYTLGTPGGQVSHAFRDLALDSDIVEASFVFDWHSKGEGSTVNPSDFMNVWIVPLDYIPQAGTAITPLEGSRFKLGLDYYFGVSEFTTQNVIVDLSAFAGQNIRLVFEWKNDSNAGNQPPAAVDNIQISKISCPAVTDLKAYRVASSKDIRLTWVPKGTETEWEVFVLRIEQPAPTPTSVGIRTSDPFYTIIDIEEDTFFKFYVRPICGEDDLGFLEGPSKFSIFNPQACPNISVEVIGAQPNEDDKYVLCDPNPVQVTLDASYLDLKAATSYDVAAIDYAPPFPFVGGGAIELKTDDKWSEIIPLGFDFCFFGNSYNKLLITENGAITFSIKDKVPGGRYIPGDKSGFKLKDVAQIPYSRPIGSLDPDTWMIGDYHPPYVDAIFGVLQDLDPRKNVFTGLTTPEEHPSPEDFSVNYQILGTAPCRALVFNIYHLGLYGVSYNPEDVEGTTQTTQLVLYEGTNAIEVYVKNRPVNLAHNDGKGLLGIQNSDGSIAVTPEDRNLGAWEAVEEAWRFTPSGESNASFQWLKDGVVVATTDKLEVSVDESTTYTAKVIYEQCGGEDYMLERNFEFIKENLSIPELQTLYVCPNLTGPMNQFDLSGNEDLIFEHLNEDNYEVAYFSTLEDLTANVNQLQTTYRTNEKSQAVFVKLMNKYTSCFAVSSFELSVLDPVLVPKLDNVEVCGVYKLPALNNGEAYFTKPLGDGVRYEGNRDFSEIGVHTLYVYKENESGCFGESSFEVRIIEPIQADVLPSKLLQCEKFILPELSLNNRYFTASEMGGVELFAGMEIIDPATIYIYAKNEGKEQAFCWDESNFTIDFEDCPIPKGISPNGDGYNDALDLTPHGISEIKIYNRYGTEVFSHGRNYINQWKGQDSKGNELPDGTYYYVIISHGKTKTGWIQINR